MPAAFHRYLLCFATRCIMTISLVSDITLKSSQVKLCVTDKHNTKYNTHISEQPYIHARWSIFTFPGQNEPRPGHGTP